MLWVEGVFADGFMRALRLASSLLRRNGQRFRPCRESERISNEVSSQKMGPLKDRGGGRRGVIGGLPGYDMRS